MTYDEIVALALSYSDREDIEVAQAMDSFLRIVEARVNRVLHVRKMAVRAVVPTIADQEYYGLPSDFSGLRDIEIYPETASNARTTMHYATPEQMNTYAGVSGGTRQLYTIVADQLQIMPPKDGYLMEIVYYQKLLPLGTVNASTWLSISNPDVYVFGLLVEINSFVKDAEAKAIWDDRYKEALIDLDREDQKDRWSGTSLTIRVG